MHFEAPALADVVRSNPAMLYFVFGPSAVAVLIAHNIEQGQWVAQLPYFPGLEDGDALDAAACRSTVAACIGGTSGVPFDVKSCTSWAMSAKVAQRMTVGRVHLLGAWPTPCSPRTHESQRLVHTCLKCTTRPLGAQVMQLTSSRLRARSVRTPGCRTRTTFAGSLRQCTEALRRRLCSLATT